MNQFSTLIPILKNKLKPIWIPLLVIFLIALLIRLATLKPFTNVRAESDGVNATFSAIDTPLDQNKDWTWNATITARKHIGELVTIAYGAYWCKSSSGVKGLGKGDPCEASKSPDDYYDTLIYENRQQPVQNIKLELNHKGVACGRIQVDLSAFGGTLGTGIYDTGVSCYDRNVPALSIPTSSQLPNTTNNNSRPLANNNNNNTDINNSASFDEIIDCLTYGICISINSNNQNQPTGTQPGASITPNPSESPQTTPPLSGTLDYYIPFRDRTVPTTALMYATIKNKWKYARMDHFDTIVSRSVSSGWNPAFILAIWMEETHASQVTLTQNGGGGCCKPACPDCPDVDYCSRAEQNCSRGHLGCNVGHDQKINDSLDCVFNGSRFKDLTNDQFEEFMTSYAGFPLSDHMAFVNNLRKAYSSLIPSGHGALVPK